MKPEELKEGMKFVFTDRAGENRAGIEGVVSKIDNLYFYINFDVPGGSYYFNSPYFLNEATLNWFDWGVVTPEEKLALTPKEEEEKYRKARHEDMKYLFRE